MFSNENREIAGEAILFLSLQRDFRQNYYFVVVFAVRLKCKQRLQQNHAEVNLIKVAYGEQNSLPLREEVDGLGGLPRRCSNQNWLATLTTASRVASPTTVVIGLRHQLTWCEGASAA